MCSLPHKLGHLSERGWSSGGRSEDKKLGSHCDEISQPSIFLLQCSNPRIAIRRDSQIGFGSGSQNINWCNGSINSLQSWVSAHRNAPIGFSQPSLITPIEELTEQESRRKDPNRSDCKHLRGPQRYRADCLAQPL